MNSVYAAVYTVMNQRYSARKLNEQRLCSSLYSDEATLLCSQIIWAHLRLITQIIIFRWDKNTPLALYHPETFSPLLLF